MIYSWCLFALLFMLLPSPRAKAQEFSQEQLLGIWKIEKVWEGEQNVTEKHNPKENRWIELEANGFTSGGNPYGKNTGKWTFDASKNILSIDSYAGEDDDSEWEIKIESNKMLWVGTEKFRTTHVKLEYLKVNQIPK